MGEKPTVRSSLCLPCSFRHVIRQRRGVPYLDGFDGVGAVLKKSAYQAVSIRRKGKCFDDPFVLERQQAPARLQAHERQLALAKSGQRGWAQSQRQTTAVGTDGHSIHANISGEPQALLPSLNIKNKKIGVMGR